MDVREALLLPSFADAEVMAGAAGLGNELSSAMVLEAADIENWGKRGQLIITSFFALQEFSDADMARFFHTMSTLGIAAMAFKPARLWPSAPDNVIALCEDFGVPLIKLSPTVKYEAIMLDVLGHVLDSNLTLLNRFYDAHRHTMALALKQPSIPYILNTLKNTLRMDVSYLDTTRDRRLGTDPSLLKFSAYSFTRREPSALQTHAYFDATLYFDDPPFTDEKPTAERLRETFSDEGGRGCDRSQKALAVRIPSSDGIDYYLLVHESDVQLTPLDVMTIENIVGLIQMKILEQNAIKQKLFIQNNNAVHDLLLDRCGSGERLDSMLTVLGIDEYPFYEVLYVRVNLSDSTDIDRLDELQQAIRRRIRSAYPGIVYFINNDRIVFLHNFRSPLTRFDLDLIQSTLEKLHASSTLPLFTHLITLSSIVDKHGLARANTEVLNVARLFDGPTHADRAVRFEDLGAYKLLLAASDLSQLAGYMDPRVVQLSEKQPELFTTLVTFCENGMDFSKTGQDLFIHPKTVRYRVDRARQSYGVDVKNPDDFLQVMLTSKIMALGGEG